MSDNLQDTSPPPISAWFAIYSASDSDGDLLNTTHRPPPSPSAMRGAAHVRGLWVMHSSSREHAGSVLQLHPSGATTIGRAAHADFQLDDEWLSREHVRVKAHVSKDGKDSWEIEDLGTSNGTFVNGKRLTRQPLNEGDVVRLGGTVLVFGAGVVPSDDFGITGLSVPTQRVRELVSRYTVDDSPVYVTGAPGTGKEIVARAIHTQSRRRGRLHTLNMATVVESLAESLLFGHRRGAFSGAIGDQKGAFDIAAEGTLVLDEVAEITANVQAKLLRAVQFREIHRIGDKTPHHVDVKVVVTTHRDLERLVETDAFREDLFWRLASSKIELLPLAQRRLDVVPLLQEFLSEFELPPLDQLDVHDKSLPYHVTTIIDRALRYAWPGNARELRDEVRHLSRAIKLRLAAKCDSPLPPLEDAFSARVLASSNAAPPPLTLAAHALPEQSLGESLPLAPDELRALFDQPNSLRRAIHEHAQGNVRRFSSRAATLLGVRPESVRRRIYRSLNED